MTRPNVGDLIRIGGEYGTAQAEHVLEGYTIGTEDGIAEGTMLDNGVKIITPGIIDQALNGFYDNGSKVVGDANFKAENIPMGLTFFGVVGARTTIPCTAGSNFPLFARLMGISAKSTTWYELPVSATLGNIQGTVRVSYDLKTASVATTAYGNVFINDVEVGTLRSTTSTSYVTFTQDFNIKPGDKISVAVRGSNTTNNVTITNFYVKTLQNLITIGTFQPS